jgi:nitrogen fixation/metabolism regulation signal transduction histidine kinase
VLPFTEEWKNMASKRFFFQLILRVLVLTLSIALFCILALQYTLPFTLLFLGALVVIEVVELIRFVNHSNKELQKFLHAISYGDYSVNFRGSKLGKSFVELNQSFHKLIEQLKSAEAEKQSQTELLKLVFEHIKLGLIVVDRQDNIQFMNTHAQELLGIPQFRKWSMLHKNKPAFTEQLLDFSFEGRKLISLDDGYGQKEYYLDLQQIQLLGVSYHLISFSDLKNEIEQKEIEAWHKLIRILAHEVMNSVTPVTSLSETVRDMLTDKSSGEIKHPSELDAEDIKDMTEALNTVVKRSKGMLSFVEEYRRLTKLPAPRPELINIKQFLQECLQLMKVDADKRNIQIDIEVQQSSLAIKADRKMMEQSLINLMSNAFYAMENSEAPVLKLKGSYKEEYTEISVSDNGKGIEEEILPSIFIPFFSTRKNGSGIGLTLIKNIMKQHQGSVQVESKVGVGTTFRLRFRN